MGRIVLEFRDSYFYPRPPRGGRHQREDALLTEPRFLSTPSARRATATLLRIAKAQNISIHALREEGDCRRRACMPCTGNFYPRPPRGGRPHVHAWVLLRYNISIHALREEGDHPVRGRRNALPAFLSTPSARRATICSRLSQPSSSAFLSTPSARRATCPQWCPCHPARHFYPRPPRGGRRPVCGDQKLGQDISIHALREEGDIRSHKRYPFPEQNFYPRPPRGGRRTFSFAAWRTFSISIHALREEGDSSREPPQQVTGDFYPRPPRGGRPSTPSRTSA